MMQIDLSGVNLFIVSFVCFLIIFAIWGYRRGILWFQQQDREAELAGR